MIKPPFITRGAHLPQHSCLRQHFSCPWWINTYLFCFVILKLVLLSGGTNFLCHCSREKKKSLSENTNFSFLPCEAQNIYRCPESSVFWAITRHKVGLGQFGRVIAQKTEEFSSTAPEAYDLALVWKPKLVWVRDSTLFWFYKGTNYHFCREVQLVSHFLWDTQYRACHVRYQMDFTVELQINLRDRIGF